VIDRFELIIFDCDGVLVDSERLSLRVDAIFLKRLGWPMA
jgi:beta-phosphoglucomutase-like phosphatase (HAD superfamily)